MNRLIGLTYLAIGLSHPCPRLALDWFGSRTYTSVAQGPVLAMQVLVKAAALQASAALRFPSSGAGAPLLRLAQDRPPSCEGDGKNSVLFSPLSPGGREKL
jgi:hypothetical protein